MARDKPIYATVSTIQLLVTSLTNNTSSIVVLSRTLPTHFSFKQFIDLIDFLVTGQCAAGIIVSAWADTFRLPVPALGVESRPMSVSVTKRLTSYMPFFAWCVGVAFLRGHANQSGEGLEKSKILQ